MFFPDYHLHSSFSSDADYDIMDIISTAQKKRINSICITDHYDIDFPIDPDEPDMTFYLDTEKYYNHMAQIQKNVAPDFDLRIGVELGIMPHISEKLNTYVLSHPELDFIIASAHIVDGYDPYKPDYFVGKTDYQAYRRYFETILESIKSFTNFNVLGHIDYILRYGKNKADNFNVSDYQDIFEEIFKIVVQNGKGIEINTGSLYKNLSFPHPHKDILKLYKDAGGEIITVGSDAHKPEYIGYGFDVAKEVLLECGFKYYSTFSKQKPEFHTIT